MGENMTDLMINLLPALIGSFVLLWCCYSFCMADNVKMSEKRKSQEKKIDHAILFRPKNSRFHSLDDVSGVYDGGIDFEVRSGVTAELFGTLGGSYKSEASKEYWDAQIEENRAKERQNAKEAAHQMV